MQSQEIRKLESEEEELMDKLSDSKFILQYIALLENLEE
jgi:hypothetical protein